MMPSSTIPDKDRVELDLLLRGFQVSRMLRTVADLGIADRIAADATVLVTELASACHVRPAPLLRILRALAAFGVFHVSPDGRVSHSVRSRLLRTDTPNSFHHAARFWTAPGAWNAWARLDAALADENPHQVAWGMSRFDYLRHHPDEARAFDLFMASFPDNRHAAVGESYDFSAARLIVDVGGGNGETLRHILDRFPAARGVIFDRPDVVEAIPSDRRMEGRIALEGGSFFDKVPPGADHYLLIRVLHDWNDDDYRRIVRACRASMSRNARLLIGEQILEPDPARGRAADYLIDVHMMAMFGDARERTEAEHRDLLMASGFALRRVIGTPSPVSLLEAVPV
jgi:hypothetical protein